MSAVRWPRRPWRRFWFLEPELPGDAVIGARGPLIGAAGVISMMVYGSSEGGRISVSTYRGCPPGPDELETVQAFNMTDEDQDRTLQYADTTVEVDGSVVPGRLAFVPASPQVNVDRWAVLLFGTDYSAAISLDGMIPELLVLSMKNDDTDYTDLRTAFSHPGGGHHRR